MKKVLFIATLVKLHIMVFHIPYLEWFKKNGYEVHVAARNDYENIENCKIPFCDEFIDLPFERSPMKTNNIYVLRELKRIIDINEYEIIHCHTPIGGVLGRLASRDARDKGTTVIYTAHGFHFFKGAPLINWLVYYPIERWLARFTDLLITINTEDFDRAKNFPAKRVKYIPGVGIDLEKFENLIIDESIKREDLGIPKDAVIVLSVGELNKNKNHKSVIKALSKLKNRKFHYIICGEGTMKADLEVLSKKLGVQEQVHLLGFRSDISEIYRISDIFIFPSFREGLSVSLMEAMANSMPVICSNIRGNSDLILDNRGGYLVNIKDINKISEMLDQLIQDENLRIKFGEYNLRVINNFEKSLVMDMMSKLYLSE